MICLNVSSLQSMNSFGVLFLFFYRRLHVYMYDVICIASNLRAAYITVSIIVGPNIYLKVFEQRWEVVLPEDMWVM